MVILVQSTPVRRRLIDRQQSHGWSDPAGRDSAGSNPSFTTDVPCSRISHISGAAGRRVRRFRGVDESFLRLQSARSRYVVV